MDPLVVGVLAVVGVVILNAAVLVVLSLRR